MSDTIPVYQRQIAPPGTSGLQHDPNIVARNQSGFAAAQGLAQSVGQTADIFSRLGGMKQQASMWRDMAQYRTERDGLFASLRQNPHTLESWSADQAGNPSEAIRNWEESRLANLGQGLKGKYREAFESQVREETRLLKLDIEDMATTYSHESIRTANAEMDIDNLRDPNTVDYRAGINDSIADNEQRLAAGEGMGIYSPAERASMSLQHASDARAATYGAIATEIQSPNGWTDIYSEERENYSGLDGALEFFDDQVAQEQMGAVEAESYKNTILTADTEKYSRGVKIQQELSNEAFLEYMQRIRVGDVVGLASEIESDPRFRPEHHAQYNRVGDRAAANSLLGALEQADTKASEPGERFIPQRIIDQYYEGTWDDARARSWLDKSWRDAGMSFDDYMWLRGKSRDQDTMSTSNALRDSVNTFYGPMLKEAEGDNARTAELEAEKILTRSHLENIIARPGITVDDVPQVMSNFAKSWIDENITKEYIRDDPRRTNPAELINLQAQQGYLQGISGAQHMSENVIRAHEVQRGIVNATYGEENYRTQETGEVGTPDEGRVYFKVYDDTAFGGEGGEIWVTSEVTEDERGGLEEQLFQLRTYRDANGVVQNEVDRNGEDIWDPISRPDVLAGTAAEIELEANRRRRASGDVEAGLTWDNLVNKYGESRINNWFGGATNIPGGPNYTGIANSYMGQYNHIAPDGVVSFDELQSMMEVERQTGKVGQEDINEFFNLVFEDVHDSALSEIDSRVKDGTISLRRNSGKVRNSALRTMESQIYWFGLPPEYAQTFLDEVLELNP